METLRYDKKILERGSHIEIRLDRKTGKPIVFEVPQAKMIKQSSGIGSKKKVDKST